MKILEKPIISMDTGKVLGSLKGIIYQNQKVTSLYCKFIDAYVYIPIEDTLVGPDAIILKTTENQNILSTDVAPRVYSNRGEEIGSLTSIEMDESFNITGISVDQLYIDINKVIHMGKIIIIETEETARETPPPSSLLEIASAIEEVTTDENPLEDDSLNVSDCGKVEAIDCIEVVEEIDNSIEDSLATTLEVIEIEDISKTEVDSTHEEIPIEIDPRYSHLFGKALLADVTILREVYKKGTLVDAALLQFALNNNAIVKLIMNTED